MLPQDAWGDWVLVDIACAVVFCCNSILSSHRSVVALIALDIADLCECEFYAKIK